MSRVVPSVSLVVPAYDEEANLSLLLERVRAALGDGQDWELVLVDDGSHDDTASVIRTLARDDAHVVGVFLERNCGQSTALAAGFLEARGAVIASLDADLQNDPADLPALIERLPGHDAVVGFRAQRQDTWVRRLSSLVANSVRNRLSHDSIRDTGCALKVFRAEALRSIPWFDGMHRFLPTLLRYQGWSVVEVPVSHHPRHAGHSKYGIRNRAFRSFVDLLGVRWMRSRRIHTPVREVVRGA